MFADSLGDPWSDPFGRCLEVALHTSLISRNSAFLISAFLVHSDSLFTSIKCRNYRQSLIHLHVVWWPVFGSDRTFTLDLALKVGNQSIKLSLGRARCLDDTPEIRSELWFYGICDQIIHHCRISPVNPDISRPALCRTILRPSLTACISPFTISGPTVLIYHC